MKKPKLLITDSSGRIDNILMQGLEDAFELYGVSNNKGRFWDISNPNRELGYYPGDEASLL